MEIWKPIKDYEGIYEISNLGRVKSLKRINSIILKHGLTKDGYPQLNLYKNGKVKVFRVHTLVAINFIENTFNKETVNHINGIKNDNRVENLEWLNRQEQTIHSFKNKLQTKTNNKIVLNIENGVYYESVVEASICFNLKKSSLVSKLNGTRKNNTNLIYC